MESLQASLDSIYVGIAGISMPPIQQWSSQIMSEVVKATGKKVAWPMIKGVCEAATSGCQEVAWKVLDYYSNLSAYDICSWVVRTTCHLCWNYPRTSLIVGAYFGFQAYMSYHVNSELASIMDIVENGVGGPPPPNQVATNNERLAYAASVVQLCKSKFGSRENTEATRLAIRRFAHGEMVDHGVRPSHISKCLDLVVAATLTPTSYEIFGRSAGRTVTYASRLCLYDGTSLLGLLVWNPLGWIIPGGSR